MSAPSVPRSELEDAVLFRLLRFGVAFCFIGHGAFGLITKKAWLPYFALGGVPESVAWHLMPWIGAMDIAMGFLALVFPTRALFLWAAIWTIWTALCRPFAGEGWPEFFERAGNYGVPLAILAVVGLRAPWFARLPESGSPLVPAVRDRLAWVLRLATVMLVAGHGACGVVLQKSSLAHHYAVFTTDSAALMPAIGYAEFALALLVLIRPTPALLVGVAFWKFASECLFLTSGVTAPWFEVLERGGSYVAPLALAYLLPRASRTQALPQPAPIA